jgi:sulfur transfer complex TusBCD TusB component (DsrH family)
MRKIGLILICILLFALGGCGPKSQTSNAVPAKEKEKVVEKVTAKSVVDKLKTKESSYMIDITVITAENDPNKFLGRPNQYTEKITWKDNRSKDSQVDCSVELFANKEDATARKAYIEGIIKSMPILTQYIIQKDNVLLRIDGVLTPAESKEYTDIFNNN